MPTYAFTPRSNSAVMHSIGRRAGIPSEERGVVLASVLGVLACCGLLVASLAWTAAGFWYSEGNVRRQAHRYFVASSVASQLRAGCFGKCQQELSAWVSSQLPDCRLGLINRESQVSLSLVVVSEVHATLNCNGNRTVISGRSFE